MSCVISGVFAMTLDEKIHKYVQKLPRSLQEELLDYVEYLVMKAEQQEQRDWTSLSLSSATRDMEDEQVSYTISDLRESFG
jgi:hypothetical protein